MITVIYYTSNRESEVFENKIKDRILKAIGTLPLISVSQRPINFGHNICVGDIGASDENILKQLLLGCEKADTPFVATAEADCLYPPAGYFDFKPDDTNAVYRYTNLWILARGWKHYRKKAYSLCAQISGRKYLINRLKEIIGPPLIRGKDIVDKKTGWIPFENALPCINIKTGHGLRKVTGTTRGASPEDSLAHWGSAIELKTKMGI